MGRFFVGILVIIAVIPAFGLAMLWLGASRNRQVDIGAISLYRPTAEAGARADALVRRRSRSSAIGVVLGLAGVIALAVFIGSETVFFWVPLLALGGLLGVLIGTATPTRSTWESTAGRRPVALGPLPLAMRLTAVLSIGLAVAGYFSGPPTRLLAPSCAAGVESPWPAPEFCLIAGVLVLLCWGTTELTLIRVGRASRIPVDGSDVAVDDATRSAISHTATGVTTLVSLGSLSVIGVGLGLSAASSACTGSGSIGTVLLTAGLAAAIASVLMAGFLIQWGIQLRAIAERVRRESRHSSGVGG